MTVCTFETAMSLFSCGSDVSLLMLVQLSIQTGEKIPETTQTCVPRALS